MMNYSIFFVGSLLSLLWINSMMVDINYLTLSKIYLIFLSFWLTVNSMMSSMQFSYFNLFFSVMSFNMMGLGVSFMLNSLIQFYFGFELSLLMVFCLVMMWGYQPERMKASMLMFFYTAIGSLPLFTVIILLKMQSFSCEISILQFENYYFNSMLSLMLIFAFLIKLPIFLVHNWLPKAHVEAPVSGSMLLAGVMLKLGGIGVLLISYFNLFKWTLLLFSFLSMFGGSILSILIISLSDIKVMIAYSSVVHMSMLTFCLIISSELGVIGGIMMMLAHGLTSSAMFSIMNFFYKNSHSRSIFLNKGLNHYNSSIVVVWFILIMLNFGGPFSINMFSEINMFSSSMNIFTLNATFVFCMGVMALVYNLIIFSSVMQGYSQFFFSVYKAPSHLDLINWGMMVWPSFGMMLILSL